MEPSEVVIGKKAWQKVLLDVPYNHQYLFKTLLHHSMSYERRHRITKMRIPTHIISVQGDPGLDRLKSMRQFREEDMCWYSLGL